MQSPGLLRGGLLLSGKGFGTGDEFRLTRYPAGEYFDVRVWFDEVD